MHQSCSHSQRKAGALHTFATSTCKTIRLTRAVPAQVRLGHALTAQQQNLQQQLIRTGFVFSQGLQRSSRSAGHLSHVACKAGFGFGSKGLSGSKGGKDCPCGSGRLYSDCCQRYHKSSSLKPDSPEKLVAARYSAFVKKDVKFLRRSSHPDNPALKGSSTAPDAEVQKTCTYEEDLAVTFLSVDFVGFDILGSSGSGSGGDGSSSATVDYTVRFKRKIDSTGAKVKQPQEESLSERATVVKDADGAWLVIGVEQLPAAT